MCAACASAVRERSREKDAALLLCVLSRLLAELLGLFRLLRKDLLDLCMRPEGVSTAGLGGEERKD